MYEGHMVNNAIDSIYDGGISSWDIIRSLLSPLVVRIWSIMLLRRGPQQIFQRARARRALPTTATAPAPAYLEIAADVVVDVEAVVVLAVVVPEVPAVVVTAEPPEALPSKGVRHKKK